MVSQNRRVGDELQSAGWNRLGGFARFDWPGSIGPVGFVGFDLPDLSGSICPVGFAGFDLIGRGRPGIEMRDRKRRGLPTPGWSGFQRNTGRLSQALANGSAPVRWIGNSQCGEARSTANRQSVNTLARCG
jgi:hypothetical protein